MIPTTARYTYTGMPGVPAPAFLPITENDLGTLRDIYDHYVRNTTATFHSEPVTTEELKEFLSVGNPKYPSFLIHEGDTIIGYCFLTR